MYTKINTDNKEYKYQYYIVAFFDILGQKESLLKLQGAPFNEEEIAPLLANTLGNVLDFRNTFNSYFESYAESKKSINENETDHPFWRMQQNRQIKINTHSDSITVWSAVSSNNIYELHNVLNTIFSILCSAGGTINHLFAKHLSVRGGIDVGLAAEYGENYNEIYGPAFLSSYILESERAKYPRLLIGDGLITFLRTAINAYSDFSQDSVEKKYLKSISNQCLSFLKEESFEKKEEVILDHFGREMRGMISFDKDGKNAAKELYQRTLKYIKLSIESFEQKPYLKNRYMKLLEYIKSNEKHWLAN